MYEEKKNIPAETCCAVNTGEPLCICEKAKRIRDASVKAKTIALSIQGTMFSSNIPTPPGEKEATCLDDELNGIYDEMCFLLETLMLINRGLSGDV